MSHYSVGCNETRDRIANRTGGVDCHHQIAYVEIAPRTRLNHTYVSNFDSLVFPFDEQVDKASLIERR